MKVKDLLKKLGKNNNLYIEFIEKDFASYGFYTKNELIYNDRFSNEKVKEFNIQYINKKLVLEIYI